MRLEGLRVPAVVAVSAVTVLLLAPPVAAQDGIGFGVSGGITRSTLQFDGASDIVESRNGWMAGIWFGGNRNGVVGVMGELDYVVKKIGSTDSNDEIEVKLLEIPVLLRVNVGSESRNGVVGYGIVGPVFDIKIDDLGLNISDEYQGLDVGIMAGGGIELARVALEVRGNWGLREVIEGDVTNTNKIRTFTLQALVKLRLN